MRRQQEDEWEEEQSRKQGEELSARISVDRQREGERERKERPRQAANKMREGNTDTKR